MLWHVLFYAAFYLAGYVARKETKRPQVVSLKLKRSKFKAKAGKKTAKAATKMVVRKKPALRKILRRSR